LIDDVEFEIDGGYGEEPPYQVKAFLVLKGDMVEECEKYLADEDASDIWFEIGRNEAEKLLEQLAQALRG
jgi:hypothetical protein